ncbi:hypothetical protein BSL78_21540 [Apostichopus japonicus]|uniref:Uncharacterized protein n=1 Tax=Stichopus japonicus TaxID=307972 RepID=A0A2G8K0X4_STIJA|nr:hypothetical protein BSL78_21540 [Apostichopus japonicus]
MKFLVFFALIACACAHLCLISPPQRGSMMGLNKAGSDDCFLVKPACGERPANSHRLQLEAGANFTVTFQKNLDHWLKKTPGHFLVSLVDEKVETRLAMIPDKGEPNLTLYSKNVTMPSAPLHKPLTLQVIYVTMNHDAPPMFYQCSDIELYASK